MTIDPFAAAAVPVLVTGASGTPIVPTSLVTTPRRTVLAIPRGSIVAGPPRAVVGPSLVTAARRTIIAPTR
ncbi:MAG: hypothetical protein RL531_1894, partial [Actinomycetota bacterium]